MCVKKVEGRANFGSPLRDDLGVLLYFLVDEKTKACRRGSLAEVGRCQRARAKASQASFGCAGSGNNVLNAREVSVRRFC